MLRAVILDLDGTLNTSQEYYRVFEREYLKFVAHRLGVNIATAKRKIANAKKKLLSTTKSVEYLGISRKDFYRELAERLPVSRLILPNPRIQQLVKDLKKKGLSVCVLTNTGSPLASKVLRALGIRDKMLDCLVTSSEVEPKPSREAFSLALKRLRVDAEEAAYVGDRILQELKPAKEAGLLTVLVGRVPQAKDLRWVDRALSSVYELPQLIERWAQETAEGHEPHREKLLKRRLS